MPTYQYECDGCGYAFEVLQSMTDRKLAQCPQCHEPKLHRLIGTGAGVIFKGSGFYETDYKVKPEPAQKDEKLKPKSAESNKNTSESKAES